MRIVDADILCYALLKGHVANPFCEPIILMGLRGKLDVSVTPVTLLETYNTLYWDYHVRPKAIVLKKVRIVAEGLKLTATSKLGYKIAEDENIPLGDGLLIGTALENKIPIILSNDSHIKRKAGKYGLIVENPIPEQIRRKMGEQT